MAGEILDSGNRRQFNSGAVRDMAENKGATYLLPLDIISEFTAYIENDYKLQNVEFTETLMFDRVYHFMQTGNNNLIFDLLIEFINKEYDSVETAIIEYSCHCQNGMNKYGQYNWNKGLPTHCFLDSGLRHGLKYFRQDQDEPHNRAFMWNFFGLLWTRKHHPEVDDIFYGNDYSGENIDKFNEKWSDKKEEKKDINSVITPKEVEDICKDENISNMIKDTKEIIDKEVDNYTQKTLYLCCYFELEEKAKKIINLLDSNNDYITICCNEDSIRFNYNEEIHINTANNAIYIQESILIKKGIIFEEGKHIDPDKFYVVYPMISSFKKFEYKILEN